ncbi:MAG: mechanosensitive ion channel [Candidatus Eisenbacteria bacterium]|uniref:Mechanosensitive ion channel n=1 Tax=Eiseniibacteriota bacterium TaxID=2212470 RepID=A0A7Y2ED98_UNCEI|nr:mechanosensitive ion channel [Candidatus Eisenbacteria bacterium]
MNWDLVISSIEEVWSGFWDSLLAYFPSLLAGLIILGLGIPLAKLIEIILRSSLRRMGLDKSLEHVGLSAYPQKLHADFKPSHFLAKATYWVVLILVLQIALRVADVPFLAETLAGVLSFVPKLLAAFAIVLAAILVGRVSGRVVRNSARAGGLLMAGQLGSLVSLAIVVVGISMAIAQLGIQSRVISISLILVVGALAFSAMFALAVGSQDAIRNIIAGFYLRKQLSPGSEVEVGKEHGTLAEVEAVQTRLVSKGKDILLNNREVLNSVVRQKPSRDESRQ